MTKFVISLLATWLLSSCTENRNTDVVIMKSPNPEQITVDSTSWTYQASIVVNKCQKTVQFLKYPIDSPNQVYSEIRYFSDSIAYKNPMLVLTNELPYIKKLWDTLSRRIKINLRSAIIGNPETYEDVLYNYVKLLENSQLGTTQLRKKERK
jgi:hypothetical protein